MSWLGWDAACLVVLVETCGMSDIVLSTLNARWSHAAMGLRCLAGEFGGVA